MVLYDHDGQITRADLPLTIFMVKLLLESPPWSTAFRYSEDTSPDIAIIPWGYCLRETNHRRGG